MLYHRGQESDYDAWGVDGWAGKDVLPYFKKAEVTCASLAVGVYCTVLSCSIICRGYGSIHQDSW